MVDMTTAIMPMILHVQLSSFVKFLIFTNNSTVAVTTSNKQMILHVQSLFSVNCSL